MDEARKEARFSWDAVQSLLKAIDEESEKKPSVLDRLLEIEEQVGDLVAALEDESNEVTIVEEQEPQMDFGYSPNMGLVRITSKCACGKCNIAISSVENIRKHLTSLETSDE